MPLRFRWLSEIIFVKVIYRHFLINQIIEILFDLCAKRLKNNILGKIFPYNEMLGFIPNINWLWR